MNKYLINLKNSLEALKKKCSEIEIKAEFESEGSMLIDIAFLNSQCKRYGLPLNVKISGPEALRDIYELSYLDIDGLIVPIVESAFSVQKFRDSLNKVSDINSAEKLAVLIESTEGIKNISNIVNQFGPQINTLIIGRSDLLSSYNLNKKNIIEINSKEFLDYVFSNLRLLKKINNPNNISIGLGGKLSVETLNIIENNTKYSELIDFVETRKVIIPLQIALKDKDILSLAIDFEKSYLSYKLNYINNLIKTETSRILLLESRLNTQE